jgi:hypothetical protein
MKAMYETNVNGNTYQELIEKAWNEASTLFGMKLEDARRTLYAEMHIRKTLDGKSPYAGSVFFNINPNQNSTEANQ